MIGQNLIDKVISSLSFRGLEIQHFLHEELDDQLRVKCFPRFWNNWQTGVIEGFFSLPAAVYCWDCLCIPFISCG